MEITFRKDNTTGKWEFAATVDDNPIVIPEHPFHELAYEALELAMRQLVADLRKQVGEENP